LRLLANQVEDEIVESPEYEMRSTFDVGRYRLIWNAKHTAGALNIRHHMIRLKATAPAIGFDAKIGLSDLYDILYKKAQEAKDPIVLLLEPASDLDTYFYFSEKDEPAEVNVTLSLAEATDALNELSYWIYMLDLVGYCAFPV